MSLFRNQYQEDAAPDAPTSSDNRCSSVDDEALPSTFDVNRRTSVSAESVHSSYDEPITHQPAGTRAPELSPGDSEEQPEATKALRESMRQIFLFNHLNHAAMTQLIEALIHTTANAGETLIEQGAEGDYLYIVAKGEVEFVRDGQYVGRSGSGSCFGELALLYNAPRAATVKAITDVELYALDRFKFKQLMYRRQIAKREHSRKVLGSVDVLQNLDDATKLRLADALQPVSFSKGDVVIREGDTGYSFFLIDEGRVEFIKNGQTLDQRGPGGYFGERALIENTPRQATVTAVTDLKLERLDSHGFERLIGRDLVALSRRH